MLATPLEKVVACKSFCSMNKSKLILYPNVIRCIEASIIMGLRLGSSSNTSA